MLGAALSAGGGALLGVYNWNQKAKARHQKDQGDVGRTHAGLLQLYEDIEALNSLPLHAYCKLAADNGVLEALQVVAPSAPNNAPLVANDPMQQQNGTHSGGTSGQLQCDVCIMNHSEIVLQVTCSNDPSVKEYISPQQQGDLHMAMANLLVCVTLVMEGYRADKTTVQQSVCLNRSLPCDVVVSDSNGDISFTCQPR